MVKIQHAVITVILSRSYSDSGSEAYTKQIKKKVAAKISIFFILQRVIYLLCNTISMKLLKESFNYRIKSVYNLHVLSQF